MKPETNKRHFPSRVLCPGNYRNFPSFSLSSSLFLSCSRNATSNPNCVDSLDRLVRPISGYVSSSTHSSSVMHTYANPFQDSQGCRPDSLSYGDDTTSGPIIPDLSTLRPSQLLKNSYAGTGPVPPNLDSGSGQQNLLTCLIDRLWSRQEVKPPNEYRVGEHRCSWRISTYTLSLLVILLIVIICFLGAYKSSSLTTGQPDIVDGKVPCIVVEELDSISTSNQLGGAIISSPHQTSLQTTNHHSQQQCHNSLSRDPSSFTEIFPGRRPVILTLRLTPYSYSSFWFVHSDPGSMQFQFKTPQGVRLLLLGQRTGPPSLSEHEIFQIIADGQNVLNSAQQRNRSGREASVLEMDNLQYLDSGTWYFTILSDVDVSMTIVMKISSSDQNPSTKNKQRTFLPHQPPSQPQPSTDAFQNCPSNCHSQGFCNNGNCQCFPGFTGIDCATSKLLSLSS